MSRPFDDDDYEYDRRRRRRDRRRREGTGLLAKAGYLCAIGAAFLSPLAFTPAGVVFGAFCLARGAVGHGIAVVLLSLVCGTAATFVAADAAAHRLQLEDRRPPGR